VPNSGPITKSVFSFRDENLVLYGSVSAILCDGQAIEQKLGLTRRADAQPLAGSAHLGGEKGFSYCRKAKPEFKSL